MATCSLLPMKNSLPCLLVAVLLAVSLGAASCSPTVAVLGQQLAGSGYDDDSSSSDSATEMMERFQRWKVEYNRSYATASEDRYRFQVYASNMRYIEARNGEDPAYELGETEYTDLSTEEFMAMYAMATPLDADDLDDDDDEGGDFNDGEGGGDGNNDGDGDGDGGDFDDVGSGGKGGGGGGRGHGGCIRRCVRRCVKHGKVRRCVRRCRRYCPVGGDFNKSEGVGDDDNDGHGSGLDNISGGGGGGGGGSCKRCVRRCVRRCPVHGVGGGGGGRPGCVRRCRRRCCGGKLANHAAATVTGFRHVAEDDEAWLMSAVDRQPVAAAIMAGHPDLHHFRGQGVYRGRCGSTFNHAVAVVGYGEDQDTGEKYWIVKNSWGANWGDAGYIKMKRQGYCGLAIRPSFATTM